MVEISQLTFTTPYHKSGIVTHRHCYVMKLERMAMLYIPVRIFVGRMYDRTEPNYWCYRLESVYSTHTCVFSMKPISITGWPTLEKTGEENMLR